MASLKEMKGVKPKVEALLTDYPHLRDDDNKLIANIWINETPYPNSLTAKGFLSMFSQGKLTSPESIRRIRQKLQEEKPHLKGKKAKARAFCEKEIRHNINN